MNRRTFLKIAGVTIAGPTMPALMVANIPLVPCKVIDATHIGMDGKLSIEYYGVAKDGKMTKIDMPLQTWWRENPLHYKKDDIVRVDINEYREVFFRCK